MDKFSPIGNLDIEVIEDFYKNYKANPDSVDDSWKNFFLGFELAQKSFPVKQTGEDLEVINKEFSVVNLIDAYRQRGHFFTKTNPVRQRRKYTPTLDIHNFGLEASDLDAVFQAGNRIGIGAATLRDIVNHLEATYCGSVGVEYVYVRKPEVVDWLEKRMESTKNQSDFSDEQRRHIFHHLKLAVGFENYIHRKFVGQKRFSLEGAENLIPALEAIIERGADLGIEELVIGMAHRGRLNVLANILQKPYEQIFNEFYADEIEDDVPFGDVKYHFGYENEVEIEKGKKVNLKLLPNPSHLETVYPVAEGLTRSLIKNYYGGDYNKAAAIIIHGDAAIAGQGVVYETVQMANLDPYKTGGTIHLIINNQVGFTTSYLEARSSTYCTDVAKVTRCPVFHVNGDDVEAVIHTIQLAMEFRQKFNSDVFIDMLCYRKYGHNEGDEPRFTQPLLYDIISKHPNPRDLYAKNLNEKGIMSLEESKTLIKEFNQFLDEKFKASEDIDKVSIRTVMRSEFEGYTLPQSEVFTPKAETKVSEKVLYEIANKINSLPKDIKFFKKVERIVKDRIKMVENNKLDWALGELLAYGTLVEEGYPVRITGQDSQRGTFAHRHAAYMEENEGKKYFPLKHLSEKQAPFTIYNSHLSEYAVMGFEYGYAMGLPHALTIWEAQFGDFHNVAQVIIDQYISSAFDKWGLMNDLVLFLPHGYEGQGPEHSSGRIERFLQLCANNNMQVMVPTTPANMFHLLRRQAKMNEKLPMIVFTPKSLLRHPMVTSTMSELANGSFKEVIDDEKVDKNKVKKIVFVSGRLYYDLVKYRDENNLMDTAIVRIEQLYPIYENEIYDLVQQYKNHKQIIWAQDEPENMGAWLFLRNKLGKLNFSVAAREASASTAVGLKDIHEKQLKEIINKVFKSI
ncbi:MAG: 2-oxoglutarate dehydrogenase E1 component [Draconibacterium sp.]|nr:MAG: 2-oxoglutarate dehydrogenase E1 component [Draconibacterium sp.]